MTPFDKPIHVSRPSLPPLEAFAHGLREIWDNRWLTNEGPVLQRFRTTLGALLDSPNIALFANGALALQVALQGAKLEGEVITTPFSFAATTNALAQCRLTPVFADIEPDHLTLDPDCVEALITPRTCAILAVHVFGVPCQLMRLQAIADRHGLLLIYDAAHAFGVTVDGQPIAGFGDITMFSFHATKLFHTIEGGALTFKDASLKTAFEAICNHGLAAGGDVPIAGLNAKMSEFQALMGELMLPSLAAAMAHGAEIAATYTARLTAVPGLSALAPPPAGVVTNHSFAPLLVSQDGFGLSADQLQEALKHYNVFARRYFTPLISDMTAFKEHRPPRPLTRASRVAQEIIALPVYAELTIGDVHRICDMIVAISLRHAV